MGVAGGKELVVVPLLGISYSWDFSTACPSLSPTSLLEVSVFSLNSGDEIGFGRVGMDLSISFPFRRTVTDFASS